MQERLAAKAGTAPAHGSPRTPHSAAQRPAREVAARSAEKAQAAERRAGEAEARARSLQQQLASARSGAQRAQATLQEELAALTVGFFRFHWAASQHSIYAMSSVSSGPLTDQLFSRDIQVGIVE